MFQRKQSAFIIGAILLVVLVLLYALFFFPSAQTPGIELPAPPPISGEGNGLTGGGAAGVAITPENVQGVIATLQRASSYSREIRQARYWNQGVNYGTATAEIWVIPEALRIRWADDENMIITAEAYYLWFGEGPLITRPITAGLGESLDQMLDQFQGIPSYETVLELDPAQIISAGHAQRSLDGELRYVIYVAVETGVLGYIDYFYICLLTGLLLETVTFDGDIPIYRLETLRLTVGPVEAEHFLPPDRTDATQ